MDKISIVNIEETFDNLSIEELLELEEKLIKIIKKRIKQNQTDNWKEAFSNISVWDHLEDDKLPEINRWNIEEF